MYSSEHNNHDNYHMIIRCMQTANTSQTCSHILFDIGFSFPFVFAFNFSTKFQFRFGINSNFWKNTLIRKFSASTKIKVLRNTEMCMFWCVLHSISISRCVCVSLYFLHFESGKLFYRLGIWQFVDNFQYRMSKWITIIINK